MVTSDPRQTAPTVRWRDGTLDSASRPRRTPFQRQYTPYRRTPASRRLGLSAQRLRRRSDEREPVNLKGLVGKTWRVHKATPLYSFTYQPAVLRRYARLLGAFVQAEIRKGVVIDADEFPDAAEFEVYKGLNVGSRDNKAVQITLKSRSKKDGSPVPVLVAILACVDMDEDLANTVNPAFTALPIILVRGPITLAKLLTGWLEVQFDCSISPLIVPSVHLHWMVAMWAGDVPEGRARPVELCYGPPPEVDAISRITLTVNPRDCKALWDSVHEGGDHFLETEVATFIKALEAHFYHHFSIHLSAMQLQRVGTALAYIASDGKLKMFTELNVLKILASLTELASEQLLTL